MKEIRSSYREELLQRLQEWFQQGPQLCFLIEFLNNKLMQRLKIHIDQFYLNKKKKLFQSFKRNIFKFKSKFKMFWSVNLLLKKV